MDRGKDLDWWWTDYVEEVIFNLKVKEKTRPEIVSRSPQLSFRTQLIRLLMKAADDLHLSQSTLHVGVQYLDHFMDNHAIDEAQLGLVALGCMRLAAKLEDVDKPSGITPQLLNKIADSKYSAAEFLQMELVFMDFVKYDLMRTTAPHFIDYYILHHVRCSDGQIVQKTLEMYTNHFVRYFLDISLLDMLFLRYPPSLVAAASVAACRHSLKLNPIWPDHLCLVTGYTMQNIKQCLQAMLLKRDTDFQTNGDGKPSGSPGGLGL